MAQMPHFKAVYVAFIQDMINKRYAEVLEHNAKDGQEWYIPHHGVYHPRKQGNIRVVFDCAAKCFGTSLHNNLLSWPNLMNSS